MLSKEWPTLSKGAQRLTSQIAGALWELPPTQCGRVSNVVSQDMAPQDRDKLEDWAIESFQIYEAIAAVPELAAAFGVKMKMFTSFLTQRLEDDGPTLRKLDRIRDMVPGGIQCDVDLVHKYGANVDMRGGIKDAYEHLAPIIDTDTAMMFLVQLVKSKGAVLLTKEVQGELLQQEESLKSTYGAATIVNATGVGAGELASDSAVLPVRGALLRVINDGSSFPKIENAMIVSAETRKDGVHESMAFVVPRTDEILVLGSIEHPHESTLDLRLDSIDIRKIRERCETLLPVLRNAKLDPDYPLAQGVRPYRTTLVRVERESGSCIVHCYGHGGGGWSIAFGASRECVRLVDELVG